MSPGGEAESDAKGKVVSSVTGGAPFSLEKSNRVEFVTPIWKGLEQLESFLSSRILPGDPKHCRKLRRQGLRGGLGAHCYLVQKKRKGEGGR